ncbi:hypothetical protein [Paenibacillus sp. CF384]|uniref:hypothetical protein n=1 Tax=Paenibacillus sp. CF384 TaxID=1884382 RepID=UPI0008991A78|nr:hypothetical protein [Paenibacillus sp. CF384]SDW31536.1 hypothetical protein SAMN05518855_10011052 [Paenibacillus sp. CF384]
MEKRLTRTEMLFSLGFLFMLVFAVAAFFYGVKIGSDKTEAKIIENAKHLSSSKNASAGAYQQQDLVSFYHTVFLPYREFQSNWFETIHKLSSQELTDISSSLKELSNIAEQKYGEAEHASVPKSSPLLESAQLQLLKSLRMFSEAAQRGAGSAKDMNNTELLKALMKDAYYTQGVKFAMAGQQSYYIAMLKWSASVNPNIPDHYDSTSVLSIQQWKTLPLTIKNKLMADMLNARKTLAPFYPQDLASRVDQFIVSGQASSMKMKTVDSIVDLLISTEAVRSGDFSDSKAVLYAKELLPQLPFFFPESE